MGEGPDHCGWLGGAITRLMVLGSVSKQAEQAIMRKQVNHTPPSASASAFRFLLSLRSCLLFPQWTLTCEPNNFLPMLLWLQCFIVASVTPTKTQTHQLWWLQNHSWIEDPNVCTFGPDIPSSITLRLDVLCLSQTKHAQNRSRYLSPPHLQHISLLSIYMWMS